MAGGGAVGNSASMSPTTAALQNYPVVPNSAGGAQASAAGAQPTASSMSNLQQLLQRFSAPRPGGGLSPAMQTANMGMNLAQMGAQHPAMAAPQARPVMAAQPYQGPQLPGVMGAGQGLPIGGGGQGMPGGLAALLAMQQRGGGFY